ncbi:substrate-binding domain-containing protein [Gorillibacterium massiliense]|uniref:substrate-binding domain-containing protein n=1 Tax=Gorillibacterium massiliense TaxID=1280390 RepID=UPI0004AF3C66|nr:substrate-binding domain-containing protein [Gorillibacterium massiliense]
MNGRKLGIIVGILILVAVAIIAFVASKGAGGSKGNITATGYLGGEKAGLFDDEEIIRILKEKYGITVDWKKAGSIDMVKSYAPGPDFLFPSNQVALEIFKNGHAGDVRSSEIIFNSPIVFYTWDRIADALTAQKIVHKEGDTYFADTQALLQVVTDGKTWDELGANADHPSSKLYGKATIISTDLTKSNSGNQFAGLYANLISGGIANESNIGSALPRVKAFFEGLGYLEPSSGDLFEQYLKTGMGAKPIIVGYENQMIEFAQQNPQVWGQVKDRMRILYPEPTVWSSHPLIALTPNGEKLLAALKDPKIQELAWKKHGFRSGLTEIQNDTKALGITGIPETIDAVISMPTAAIMDRIIGDLQ